MPTVIDSLIVSVGLDPSKFVQGSKDVQAAYVKTKDEAVRNSKLVEESTLKIEKAIGKVSNTVLGLFSILLGARGWKEFIQNTNDANVALGRFASQLGVSPQWVGEFEQIVRRIGGSANDAKGALDAANQAVQDFALGKGVPEAISRMTARVGGTVNFNNPADYLKSLAPILQRYAEIDAAQERYFSQQLGLTETVNQALIQQGANLQANMDKLANTQVTDAQIKASGDLQKAWADLEVHAESLGRSVEEKLVDPLIQGSDKIIHVIDLIKEHLDIIIAANKVVSDIISPLGPSPGAIPGDLGKLGGAIGDKLPSFTLQKLKKLPGSPGDRPFYGDLPAPGAGNRSFETSGFMVPGESGAFAVKVGGNEVSTGNPLPVALVQRGAATSFWDWLTGSSGGSSGSGDASTGSGPSGGGLIGGIKRFLGGGGTHAGSTLAPPPSGSAGSAQSGWWTPDRIAYAVNRLEKEAGLSHIGALGLVARWATVEAPGGPGSFNHIGKGHYGIGQWDPDRQGLTAGKADFNSQVTHAIWELNNAEKLAAAVGRNAKDYGDAARFGAMYERAGGYSSRTGTDQYMITQQALQRIKDSYDTHMGGLAQEAAHGKSFDWPVHDAFNLRYGPNQRVRNLRYGPHYGPNTHHLPGAGAGASLNNISNQYSATTDQSIRQLHIGAIHVNAPNATDAEGVAMNIQPALSRHVFAQFANGGPL